MRLPLVILSWCAALFGVAYFVLFVVMVAAGVVFGVMGDGR